MKTSLKIASVVVALALSACGGSSSDDEPALPPPSVNSAPSATQVRIADANGGDIQLGDELTASYIYADADGDPEGTSLFQWLRGDSLIVGANSLSYTISSEDRGTTIFMTVTPAADSGVSTGAVAGSNGLAVPAVSADVCETIVSGQPDMDQDGLPDCYERFIGTSVVDADSDGDNLSDFDEVVTKAFDSSINNFQFNPRIADVPDITVTFEQLPDITIEYTTSQGTTDTQGVTRTNESATTVSTSTTQQQSTSEELSSTFGSTGGTSGFDVSSSTSYSQSVQDSLSWTQGQTRENRQSLSQMRETTSTSGVSTNNGNIAISLKVKNRGYQTVTLDSMTVTAFQVDANDPSKQEVVTGMDYDTQFGSFPSFDIPGNSSSNILPYTADINLSKTFELLENSRNLSIEPSTWRIVDGDGRSYTHNLTNVQARSAQVIVDYAGTNNLEIEKYYVATVSDFQQNRISAANVMSDILKTDYTESPSSVSNHSGVTSVRTVQSNEAVAGRWLVLHNYIAADGITRERTRYDSLDGPYSLDDILLAKGEVLHFLYVSDEDNDGVFAREEFLHGTSILNADSDSDGLSDFAEIKEGWEIPVTANLTRRVYSNPLEIDADNDGLIDSDERLRGSNPSKRDTDNDGILDFNDMPIGIQDMQESAFYPLDEDRFVDANINPSARAEINGDFTLDRFGQAASAININTDEHYVSLFDFFDEDIVHGATLVFWMQIDPNLSSDGFNVYEHKNVNDSFAEQFMWVYPTGMQIFGNPFDRYSFFSRWDDGVDQFPFANWHMITIVGEELNVGEGMRSFKVYINGQFFGERTQDIDRGFVHFFNRPWFFAGPTSYNVGVSEYRGNLDDIRFFKRSLDEEEIQMLYEQ